MVTFDEPLPAEATQGQYGHIAPQGYLDRLATRRGLQDVQFTVVGYGLQLVKPVLLGERTRYVGTVSLVNLRSALTDGYNLHYSNSLGKGVGPGGHLLRRLRRAGAPPRGGWEGGDRRGQLLRPQRQLQGRRLRLPDGHPGFPWLSGGVRDRAVRAIPSCSEPARWPRPSRAASSAPGPAAQS
ncbi:hypothetical protein [Thermoflexus sp.]|uniref:hypothetical protein n=1 Tax=Thermoflexus sp. TaxID=1969742 RepID=UPI003C00C591